MELNNKVNLNKKNVETVMSKLLSDGDRDVNVSEKECKAILSKVVGKGRSKNELKKYIGDGDIYTYISERYELKDKIVEVNNKFDDTISSGSKVNINILKAVVNNEDENRSIMGSISKNNVANGIVRFLTNIEKIMGNEGEDGDLDEIIRYQLGKESGEGENDQIVEILGNIYKNDRRWRGGIVTKVIEGIEIENENNEGMVWEKLKNNENMGDYIVASKDVLNEVWVNGEEKERVQRDAVKILNVVEEIRDVVNNKRKEGVSREEKLSLYLILKMGKGRIEGKEISELGEKEKEIKSILRMVVDGSKEKYK
ncbi:MAG: hypothetical protein ACO3K7_02795, partial [Candidatus Marinamargulisbacteria bacterium]